MDSSHILELLEQLDDEVDDLEEALSPIIKTALSETASKLPVLDRAKIYVLVTYAIESILFSYLRLHGVKARDHPVFRELTRVKQYFDKIKTAENPPTTDSNQSLDKSAAKRFIAAALSGNDKYDLARAEQQAKERTKAHIKFLEVSGKRKAEEVAKEDDAADTDSSDNSSESEESKVKEQASKKQKTAAEAPSKPKTSSKERVKERKKAQKKKQRKNKKSAGSEA